MIEPTIDLARVGKFRDFSKDYIPGAGGLYYIMEVDQDGNDLGVWNFHRWPWETNEKGELILGYMVHVSMGEDITFGGAIESGFDAFGWIFSRTGAPAIYATFQLGDNGDELKKSRQVQLFAKRSGLEFVEDRIQDGEMHKFYCCTRMRYDDAVKERLNG